MNIVPNSHYSYQYKIQSRQVISESNEWDNITDPIHYTPNWLHSDGRINATLPGGDYRVAEVSPYNPNFKTQIESGVWPLVEALINKGYLTCSSCEGHGRDLQARVSLVLPTIESANTFKQQINLPPWRIRIKSKRRIYDFSSNFKTTTDILSQDELQTKVFPYYNKIFHRNYTEYHFIDMFLPKYLGYNFIYYWLTKEPSPTYKFYMQEMVNKVNDELPYSQY